MPKGNSEVMAQFCNVTHWLQGPDQIDSAIANAGKTTVLAAVQSAGDPVLAGIMAGVNLVSIAQNVISGIQGNLSASLPISIKSELLHYGIELAWDRIFIGQIGPHTVGLPTDYVSASSTSQSTVGDYSNGSSVTLDNASSGDTDTGWSYPADPGTIDVLSSLDTIIQSTGSSGMLEVALVNVDGTYDYVKGIGASIVASSNDAATLYGGSGANTYVLEAPAAGVVDTIDNSAGSSQGTLSLDSTQLTGTTSAANNFTWTDSASTTYQYAPEGGVIQAGLGTLTISGGTVGAGEIVIDNFNLAQAESSSGYLGIQLGGQLKISAGANSGGTGGSAPNFYAGSTQGYTISVNTPSTAAQTFSVSLSGANTSDFTVTANGQTIAASGGSFSVTLPAGETNVSFQLTDVTKPGSTTDISNGASLQLSVSERVSGGTLASNSLAFTYVPGLSPIAVMEPPMIALNGASLGP